MIYLFSSCGKCVEALNCKAFCHECGVWFQKPLMFYAFLAVVLSAAEIALCGYAITLKIEETCEVPDEALGAIVGQKLGVKNSLLVHMCFAWFNMIFGPYVQYRLFQELKQEAREGHTAADVADDEVDLSSQRVKSAFKDVFKYDIGICLYVLALFGSLAWSILLLGWAHSDKDCNPGEYISWTAKTGIGFFAFVCVYAVVWYAYLHCVSTVEVHGVSMAQGAVAAVVATKSPAAAKYMQPKQANARVDTPAQAPQAKPNKFGGLFSKKATNEENNVKSEPLNANGRSSTGVSSNGRAPDSGGQLPRKKSMIAAKLAASLALDAMGSASYAAPGLGEGTDIAYAPAQAVALKMMYGSNTVATVGFLEEILPGTDFVPSGLIAWSVDTFAPNNALMRQSTGSTNSASSNNNK